MKKEKVILSFIAALIGLIVASIIFYFYQGAKTEQKKIKTVTLTSPTPPLNQKKLIPLSIDTPQDESVTSQKTITISGKTENDATVVILTPTDEQVIAPSANGDFSTTTTIDNGENSIEVTAVAPNGEQTKMIKTVTYSTETF